MLSRVQSKAVFFSLALAITLNTNALAESLQSAVQFAVTENPKRLSARAGVKASAQELESARREYLPKVNLFGDVGAQSRASGTSSDRNVLASSQIGLSGSLILFDGYRRSNILYRNSARLDGSLYELVSAAEAVALNSVEAYIDVVRHYRLRAIASRNIERHRDILKQIDARVAGEKSPVSDLYQAEERVLAAEAVEIEISKALSEAKAKYKRAIGRTATGNMTVPLPKGLPKSSQALVEKSITNNVGLKEARSAIAAADYERNASRSKGLPQVSLEGRVSHGSNRNGLPGVRNDAYVGVQLSWDLFDGGVGRADTAALEARKEQVAYNRDSLVREVTEGAEQAWIAFSEQRKRNGVLVEQVSANNRIVQNYLQEYELSKRSLLDVLDAERALFNTKFQQISVEASYQFAAYRILAVQSALASHFGFEADAQIARPDFERRAKSSQNFFNIEIEHLK